MPRNELKFQEIHDEFRPRILRYLTRLVGPGEAEDLTQEVLAKISQALHAFRGESRLSILLQNPPFLRFGEKGLEALRFKIAYKPSLFFPRVF